ncbi:MAG: OmpA family protein [Azospirillaceae bacterium]
MTANRSRSVRRQRAGLKTAVPAATLGVVLAMAGGLSPLDTAARAQVVIGGAPTGVTVNLGVLNDLGPSRSPNIEWPPSGTGAPLLAPPPQAPAPVAPPATASAPPRQTGPSLAVAPPQPLVPAPAATAAATVAPPVPPPPTPPPTTPSPDAAQPVTTAGATVTEGPRTGGAPAAAPAADSTPPPAAPPEARPEAQPTEQPAPPPVPPEPQSSSDAADAAQGGASSAEASDNGQPPASAGNGGAATSLPPPASTAESTANAPPPLREADRPLTQPPSLAVPPGQTPADEAPDEVIAGALDPLDEDDVGAPQAASGQPPGPGETIGQIPDMPGYRLLFDPGSDALSTAAGSLLNGLAQRLIDNPEQTIQVRAYAQSSVDRGSDARRLSLNRALTIRTFLLDRGIRSTRIDIRALGDTAEGEPRDRVDLVFTN